MKLRSAFCLSICTLFAYTTAQENGVKYREIHLSESEPISHINDIQYHANPKFTVPPVLNGKAFTENPLVNFSANPAWKAHLYNCEGFLCLSKDQVVRNHPNLKLELTSCEQGASALLLPENKVIASRDFDTFMLLAYAKNLTTITVKFCKPDGEPFIWRSGKDMNEMLTGWNLMRVPLKATLPAGTALESIEFKTVPFRANRPPDIYHLEQFDVAIGTDHLKQAPFKFNPGKKVEIPVTSDGARPKSHEAVTSKIWKEGNTFKLRYENTVGIGVTYIYKPKMGTLEDISVSGDSGCDFLPAAGSGPVFEFGGKSYDIRKPGEVEATLTAAPRVEDGKIIADWQYRFGGSSQKIIWRLRIMEKSLVVDLDSQERFLQEWCTGQAVGTSDDAKVFEVPFMNHTPKIVWNKGWFFSHFHDHYKGNFSTHGYDTGNDVAPGKVTYHFLNSGYTYCKRSDGSRHPLRETVYLTASQNFEDVLITPSNPKSPFSEILGDNLYKKFEVRSELYQKAKKLTDLYDQYGVNHLFFDVFSFIWTSGFWGTGESSFHAWKTSYIHQKDGGDQGFCAMLQDLKDKQMIPGYYETYNALQVKSALWDPAKIAIRSDGSWCTASEQAYMLKMWALPDWEQGFFRERNKKFQPRQTGYVDGFTSRLPFMYNDYDHRYPEAGKMIDTIRAIGTGFQRIRENYGGPVFAEGRGADYYWAGLNDGDYGKLPGFGLRLKPRDAKYPLLVDFRLKKLNPLAPAWGLNIGYSLFCGNPWFMTDDYSLLYHYIAMNIAFGTVGFIEPCGDVYPDPHRHFDKTLETYYLVRQLQKRYMMQTVKEIRYFDGEKLVPTEEALVSGRYRDNMLYVLYENGLEIYINCNWNDREWRITVGKETYALPSGGWFARQGDVFLEYSALIDGHRVSYVDSPEYRYLNGYGHKVEVDGLTATNILILYKTGPKTGKKMEYPTR